MQDDSHWVSINVKIHITMYKTACPADTIDVILSNDIDHGTSPFLQILHMMDWKSKEEKDIHLLPLVDKLGCSALTFVVKMILFADLQDSSRLYYIPTNLIWTTIIYQSIQHIMIILFLIFRSNSLLIKLIILLICQTKCFNRGRYATNQKTKECRPTQIDIKEKWQTVEIIARKQKIQECV